MIAYDLDWEPEEPSYELRKAEERQRYDGGLVCDHFRRAATGEDLAAYTSEGAYALECAIERGSRLAYHDDARALLRAIVTVRALIMVRFPQWDRDDVADGANAMAAQALFFIANQEGRTCWPRADLADLGDLARRLRNNCHSAALVDRMEKTRTMYRAGKIEGSRLVRSLRQDAERIARNDAHNAEISERLAHHRGAVADLIPMAG